MSTYHVRLLDPKSTTCRAERRVHNLLDQIFPSDDVPYVRLATRTAIPEGIQDLVFSLAHMRVDACTLCARPSAGAGPRGVRGRDKVYYSHLATTISKSRVGPLEREKALPYPLVMWVADHPPPSVPSATASSKLFR